jgi:hypothetical protein
MRGMDDQMVNANITDNITVSQYGTGLVFYVGDKNSYETIYNGKEN